MTKTGPRLPDDSHRITILGKTGTGKTQLGVWHLSRRNYMVRPWLIFDYKGDELINEIQGAIHLDLGDIPKRPGIYIVHPLPGPRDAPIVDEMLWKIWARENMGVYFDEGYMIDKDSDPLQAIYTQGRSKRIPAITLSQRPVWMTRFAFSEADFIQYLYLNDKRDRQTVQAFIPTNVNTRLPDYHSYYYDVGRDRMDILGPVPSREEILASFDAKLGVRRKYI